MTAAPTVLCLTLNPSVDLATETERVLPTHKLRCGDTLHDAGGGGINVARVLTRLGGALHLVMPGRGQQRAVVAGAHGRRRAGRHLSADCRRNTGELHRA